MSDERHKVTFDVDAVARRHQHVIAFDDITRLLNALEETVMAERAVREQERADMLSLLRWVSDCWPEGNDSWLRRPDMGDCVAAIREFLGPRVPAPAEVPSKESE